MSENKEFLVVTADINQYWKHNFGKEIKPAFLKGAGVQTTPHWCCSPMCTSNASAIIYWDWSVCLKILFMVKVLRVLCYCQSDGSQLH